MLDLTLSIRDTTDFLLLILALYLEYRTVFGIHDKYLRNSKSVVLCTGGSEKQPNAPASIVLWTGDDLPSWVLDSAGSVVGGSLISIDDVAAFCSTEPTDPGEFVLTDLLLTNRNDLAAKVEATTLYKAWFNLCRCKGDTGTCWLFTGLGFDGNSVGAALCDGGTPYTATVSGGGYTGVTPYSSSGVNVLNY